jgi:hypothetical protein
LSEHDFEHVTKRRIVIEHEDLRLVAHRLSLTGCSGFANMRALPTLELLRSPAMAFRMGRVATTAAFIFASIIAGAACGRASISTQPAISDDPRDFYPLRAGNAWSYDVDTGDAVTTLAITRVEAFDGRVAEVHTGRSVLLYEVSAEGIRELDANAWVLRAPLREGASWPGRGGRSARVVAADSGARTAAGDFDDCVEVLETGGKLELEVRTLYCRGVGPVSVESTMRSKVGERTLSVSASLRGYDVSAPGSRP